MAVKTKIEWCDATWSPVTGCSLVSEGCRNCYATNMAKRFWGDREFSDVRFHEDRLEQPLKWKKRKRIFVCSMGDLFLGDYDRINDVFSVMRRSPQHLFYLLTKRPEEMVEWKESPRGYKHRTYAPFPQNVYLGVSVEDQKTADERIPLLLQIPAAKRFVSIEPMLGEVDLSKYLLVTGTPQHFEVVRGILNDNWKKPIGWIICGGESGPKARPMHPDWVRSVRDQCLEANVPFFFKQWGEFIEDERRFTSKQNWISKGRNWLKKGSVCLDETGKEMISGCDFDIATYPITIMHRVGKKNAGRLLDGREWNGFPE